MKHTNNNNIFNRTGEKAVALFIVASMLITGAVTAVVRFFNGGDEMTDEPTSAIESQLEDPIEKLLILTDPFDINDPASVEARAKAIWEISEKKYSELDITNMIYILAGKNDCIKYPKSAKTDDLKFKYLQDLALFLNVTLDDIKTVKELKTVPSGYMFIAGKTVKENEENKLVVTEGGLKAIELRKIIFTHKDNIIKYDDEALKVTAEKFYKFYKSIKDMKISDSAKFVLYTEVASTKELFSGYLSEEKANEIDNVVGLIASYKNKVFQDAATGLNISGILAEGNYGKEQPSIGEYYGATDEDVADAIKDDNSEGTTKQLDKGGEKLPSQSEMITQPGTLSTTKKEIETFNAPVTEGKVTVTDPSSGQEFVVEITGEGTYVYTIPGGEPKGDINYSDANDEKIAEELDNTYTLG